MTYVEDIIMDLAGLDRTLGIFSVKKPFEVSPHDFTYISSFAISLIERRPLTEPQRKLALKVLLKHKSNLSKSYNLDVDDFFSNTPWRNAVRVIDKTKKIYIKEDKIYLKSPYDQEFIDKIKSFSKSKTHFDLYAYDGTNKEYIFSMIEKNIKFLATNFENFEKDPKILELYEQIKIIEEQPDNYIPMTCFENNQFVYKNTYSSIPAPSKNDLIEVLWEARKYGITVWDDNIEQRLKQGSFCPMAKRFVLHSHFSTSFLVKNEEINNIGLFKKLIDSSDKILFAIAGNDQELPKIIKQLKELNYSPDQSCVLFRSSNPKFNSVNEYIKENKINNKVSDNVKFFFVDYAKPVTKVLLENEIRFDLTFLYADEMTYGLIPHTMRTFLLNCQNVVSTFDFSMSKNW